MRFQPDTIEGSASGRTTRTRTRALSNLRFESVGGDYVDHYNNVCLNSAVGYITPKDMLAGRQQEIHSERDRKLEAARKQRRIRRKQAA